MTVHEYLEVGKGRFTDSHGQNQILSIHLSFIQSLNLSIIVATEMQAYRGAWRSHISSSECALCHLIMCFMSEKHISTLAIAHNLMCFVIAQYLCAFINVFKPIFSIHWVYKC